MIYEAGYWENWLRGGVRPAIYSTLHTFDPSGPILDLSSSKWPEEAVCFIRNIVRFIFSRYRGENRGKRDNPWVLLTFPDPLFSMVFSPKSSPDEKFEISLFVAWIWRYSPGTWLVRLTISLSSCILCTQTGPPPVSTVSQYQLVKCLGNSILISVSVYWYFIHKTLVLNINTKSKNTHPRARMTR